jgi:hypothetical protein
VATATKAEQVKVLNAICTGFLLLVLVVGMFTGAVLIHDGLPEEEPVIEVPPMPEPIPREPTIEQELGLWEPRKEMV